MQEFEPKPSFEFPWNQDAQGEYLRFRVSDEQTFDLRDETTLLYLFPDQPDADHIFVMTSETDDQIMGFRLWRLELDRILGEGAFSALCDEMFEKDFDLAPDEEPSPLDIQAWEQSFGRDYVKPNPVEKIVELAMKNFDEGWRYYSEEWG